MNNGKKVKLPCYKGFLRTRNALKDMYKNRSDCLLIGTDVQSEGESNYGSVSEDGGSEKLALKHHSLGKLKKVMQRVYATK